MNPRVYFQWQTKLRKTHKHLHSALDSTFLSYSFLIPSTFFFFPLFHFNPSGCVGEQRGQNLKLSATQKKNHYSSQTPEMQQTDGILWTELWEEKLPFKSRKKSKLTFIYPQQFIISGFTNIKHRTVKREDSRAGNLLPSTWTGHSSS